MKRISTLLFLCRAVAAVTALFAFTGCSSTVHKELIGKPAPFTQFTSLSDSSLVNLDQFRGKTAVISFWSTTCNSSGPNMRRLSDYSKKFRGRNDVVFIAASLDKADDVDQVKSRIKYDGYDSFVHMYSGNAEYDAAYLALKGEELPYVVVVDPSGKIVDLQNDDSFVYSLVR